MTLAKVHNPLSPLDPGALDWYLANGWFRMGQTIFTTHILHYDQKFYSAVWLRIPLQDLPESKTLKKLKKINSDFRIVIQEACITKEKEDLFQHYKTSVPFEASASLESLLYGKLFPLNIYQTMEVCLYDQEQLIAVGFFDIGKETAAGISSFYDPSYKKNSLGKYLIYLKIEYCRLLGLHHFYPGYFVPGYSMFDYKLEIAKTSLEYYSLTEKNWLPIQQFSFTKAPLEEMRVKLSLLKDRMVAHHIPSLLLYYEFYNVNLAPEFKDLQLFDFPLFLYCYKVTGDQINPIVVFDVRDEKYHLILCDSLYPTEEPIYEGRNYSAHLLKISQSVFSSENPEQLILQMQEMDRLE